MKPDSTGSYCKHIQFCLFVLSSSFLPIDVYSYIAQLLYEHAGVFRRSYTFHSALCHLDSPNGVIIGKDNKFHVAGGAGLFIQRSLDDAKLQQTFARLAQTRAITINQKGDIMVLVQDSGIEVFNSSGNFLRYFSAGMGLMDLAFDQKSQVTYCISRSSIIVVDKTGKVEELRGILSDFLTKNGFFRSIDFTSEGNLLILGQKGNDFVVHVLNPNTGGVLNTFKVGKDPEFVVGDAAGNFAVSETGDNRVTVYRKDGSVLTQISIEKPVGIALSSDGRLLITERKLNKVQLWV